MVARKKKDEDTESEEEVYGQVANAVAAEESGEDDDNEESSEEEAEANQEVDEEEESDSDEEEDEKEYGSDQEESSKTLKKIETPPSMSGEQCTFDLRNLLAVNTHQINPAELYSKKNSKKASNDANTTIPAENLDVAINEEYLLEKATDGCAQLIHAIWQLPVERSDAGPLVTLPSYDASKIPRELPPPPPKRETKWEKFAKERGIGLNKEKRSQKVWDEATGSWMFRHGYNKANNVNSEWPIMEVKDNQDPFADPWERVREEKRSKTVKNTENRMRNQERAGVITKGTTTRVLKSQERQRQAGKAGGNQDRDKPPSGVPVDLGPTKSDSDAKSSQRGKESTVRALLATQRSTASLGKFDKMREGEPDRKKAVDAIKKRKYESATDKKVVATETERNIKLLKTVVHGGGAEREKARKKGRLAKGETAYDYEYEDGLGPSTFRKKKGRSGAGKLKKMTKKRAK